MTDNRYEKLERMRADIQRDRNKVARMLEQIKAKEAKLKEAESLRIVADVEEVKMSPEELGAFLELIRSGKLDGVLQGRIPIGVTAKGTEKDEDTEFFDEEDEEDFGDENEEK